ncbi:MAG: hypothetical protein ABI920_05700 [Casimicrobiaceae bacterium]
MNSLSVEQHPLSTLDLLARVRLRPCDRVMATAEVARSDAWLDAAFDAGRQVRSELGALLASFASARPDPAP